MRVFYFLLLGLGMLLVGCQTTGRGQQDKSILQDSEEALSIRVDETPLGYEVLTLYVRSDQSLQEATSADEEVSTSLSKKEKATKDQEPLMQVICAPKVLVRKGQWETYKSTKTVVGYMTMSEYFVGGELVRVPNSPGTVLKVRVVPQEKGIVKVQGLLSYSELSDAGHDVKLFPIDVMVPTGKPVRVYRRETRMNVH